MLNDIISRHNDKEQIIFSKEQELQIIQAEAAADVEKVKELQRELTELKMVRAADVMLVISEDVTTFYSLLVIISTNFKLYQLLKDNVISITFQLLHSWSIPLDDKLFQAFFLWDTILPSENEDQSVQLSLPQRMFTFILFNLVYSCPFNASLTLFSNEEMKTGSFQHMLHQLKTNVHDLTDARSDVNYHQFYFLVRRMNVQDVDEEEDDVNIQQEELTSSKRRKEFFRNAQQSAEMLASDDEEDGDDDDHQDENEDDDGRGDDWRGFMVADGDSSDVESIATSDEGSRERKREIQTKRKKEDKKKSKVVAVSQPRTSGRMRKAASGGITKKMREGVDSEETALEEKKGGGGNSRGKGKGRRGGGKGV